jgi:dihydroceramidase
MTPGYWGTPTSTIDWCEANYVHSQYVAEWFNTISSFAIMAVGLVGMWLHRRTLERRFHAAFAAVAVVGVGSVAFHATLRRELQMLDELPMLYSALILLFILLENRPTRRFGAWFPSLLVAHGMLVTCLASLTRGKLQFYAFHLSFGSMELFALWRVTLIRIRRPTPAIRRAFGFGVGTYVFAVALWYVDLKACGFVSVTLPALGLFNPQLHAVWHVLVSIGLYTITLVIACDRLETLGREPLFMIRGLPRVVASESASLTPR